MPNRPKVIIFGKLPPPIMGPALATKRLLASTLNERFELLHVDTRINKEVADMGKKDPAKVFGIGRIYIRLLKTLIRKEPQVAIIPIAQTTIGFLKDAPLILLCRFFGCRSLVQLRGSDMANWLSSASDGMRWWFSFCMGRSDGAIVLGDNLKYLFTPYFSEEDIFVIPNGGDYQFPTPSDTASKTIRLLSIANHLPGKGLLQVLTALQTLEIGSLPSFRYDAYGSWDDEQYQADCEAMAAQVGDGSVVTLHGPIKGADKWQELADSDLYLFCPVAPEGHPWSIVEAMAAGLPIISADQGAIIESVRDGDNGYIVDPKDTAELADRLRRLISDGDHREKMAADSRRRYDTLFTEQRMIDRYAKVLEQMVSR